MHLALASRPDDPAFAPEPTLMLDARSIYPSTRSLAGHLLPLVRQRLGGFEDDTRQVAERVLAAEGRLHERLRAVIAKPITAARST